MMSAPTLTFDQVPQAIYDVNRKLDLLISLHSSPQLIPASDEHFNVKQAAVFLGIGQQAVYNNITKIPHSKRFGKLYFLRSELETYLAQGKVKTK